MPIPPLDGGRVLTGLLPLALARQFARIEPFGFVILLLLLMSHSLGLIVRRPIQAASRRLALMARADPAQRHASDRPSPPRPPARHAQELGAAASDVRCVLLRRRLARADDRRTRTRRGIAASTRRDGRRLARGRHRSRASAIFRQSAMLEHAELFLIFAMITPTPWLLRNPTVKEQARELGSVESDDEAEMTKIDFGHLGYPVLQAADILMYKANKVPVGRRPGAARRAHPRARAALQPSLRPVFPEPQALLSEVPKIAGARRPQDEQELQQRGVPRGADPPRSSAKLVAHDDRSAARAADAIPAIRRIARRTKLAPDLLHAGGARLRRDRAARALRSAAWSARRS